MHPHAKVLYMHTKGSSVVDSSRKNWLLYMLYYNVVFYQEHVQLLDKGWETSGAHLIRNLEWPSHYSGNFFWATAGKVMVSVNITDLVWYYR